VVRGFGKRLIEEKRRTLCMKEKSKSRDLLTVFRAWCSHLYDTSANSRYSQGERGTWFTLGSASD
jgi:hypothetical protein